MEIPGFAGSILYVDLTSDRIRKEPLDPELAMAFLGGHGINCKLAYDLVPPDVDPLSPENAIIIGTGPFSGTLVPGSAELVITSNLPLSISNWKRNGIKNSRYRSNLLSIRKRRKFF